MSLASVGFHILDWIVLIAYLVGITVFGLWVSRKTRTSGGYFLGDRKLKWWIMIGQSFGTGTHAENPVGQAGATCKSGFATIWFQWKNMLITPFYWLLSPWYRRSEKTTVGEIIEERYGRWMGLLYSLFAIAFFVLNQGVMLKGAGKVVAVATGGQFISANGVVVAMTVTFILYSFIGGLVASAYTDFVQGFLIIILSFMLIPLGLMDVGGFEGMRKAINNPMFFDLFNEKSGIDAFFLAMLTLNGLTSITAMPHMVSQTATGNTERSGRVGMTYGTMVKRFCTIGWALTGLIVAAMLIQRGTNLTDYEQAFGYASRELLGPGLVGLLVACVLAANMSTCSNFMVNTGALCTRNIYRDFMNPTASDRQLLWVGRFSGLAMTLLGVLFGVYVDNVLNAFMFTETTASFMGIMFFGGIMWKRANRWGALAATLLVFIVYYIINFIGTCHGGNAAPAATLTASLSSFLEQSRQGHGLDFLRSGDLKLVYPWAPVPFAWAMLIGTIGLIVVSLLTRQEDPRRIENFFDNMRRSTDHEALPNGSPKPLAAELGTDLLLIDAPGWFTASRWTGGFKRYREDIIGFIVAWATVAAMLLLAWGMLQIGK